MRTVPVYIETSGGVLTVRSDEDPDDTNWWRAVNWRKHHENAFEIFLEDYPTLTLTVPAGTGLVFDSAVVSLAADDTRGPLSIDDGHVDGEIGDISTADINIHGAGDLKTGAIAGALALDIHGSGDFIAASAARMAANIHGSGDINIGDIAGETNTRIHGSGDINIADIGGAFSASIHGSGDNDDGRVNGGADLSIQGSGDISLASIAGGTSAAVMGSGDIDIAGGRAESLRVRLAGSGGFDFGGVAVNPDIRADNASDVYIRSHEGTVRVRGDGDVRIGNRRYNDD
ncbi:MAG: DUF2807 domain-containing protein [Pseudomonadota bacterium]